MYTIPQCSSSSDSIIRFEMVNQRASLLSALCTVIKGDNSFLNKIAIPPDLCLEIAVRLFVNTW